MSVDPNAEVADWVNIVVPTGSGLLFIIVIVLLYFTDKEIPVETLERFTQLFSCNKSVKPSRQYYKDLHVYGYAPNTQKGTCSDAPIKTGLVNDGFQPDAQFTHL